LFQIALPAVFKPSAIGFGRLGIALLDNARPNAAGPLGGVVEAGGGEDAAFSPGWAGIPERF
jgi:hypothetical protein